MNKTKGFIIILGGRVPILYTTVSSLTRVYPSILFLSSIPTARESVPR